MRQRISFSLGLQFEDVVARSCRCAATPAERKRERGKERSGEKGGEYEQGVVLATREVHIITMVKRVRANGIDT